jgi:hypothetical protein
MITHSHITGLLSFGPYLCPYKSKETPKYGKYKARFMSLGARICHQCCDYTVIWRNMESWFNSWQLWKIFLFSEKWRLVLKTTQPDIQSVLGTTHTYLVLRSSMSGPNPHPCIYHHGIYNITFMIHVLAMMQPTTTTIKNIIKAKIKLLNFYNTRK